MTNANRMLLGIVLGAIAVLILIWTMTIYPIVPRGVVLPVDGIKPPLPASTEVEFYSQYSAPFSAQKIGIINLRFHIGKQTKTDNQLFKNAASQLARQAGGNAIEIVQIGVTGPQQPKPMRVMVLQGNVLNTASKANS